MIETLAGIVIVIGGLYGVWRFFSQKILKNKKAADQSPSNEIQYESNEIYALVRRFVEIYKAHGVERTQIPRLLEKETSLTLDDVSTEEKLLSALNENMLNKTCEIFGVRREWLDGKDVPIYPYLMFDKNMKGFIDFLNDLCPQYQEVQGYIIKCPQDKLGKNEDRYPIAVVFRGKIDHWGHFSEESIWRYYPLNDEYHFWGYERTRLQLKAMVLIAWQLDIHISGHQLPREDIEAIVDGSAFPGPLIESKMRGLWHPDDYIFTREESGAVADPEEAILAREYLERLGNMDKLIALTGPIKAPFAKKMLS